MCGLAVVPLAISAATAAYGAYSSAQSERAAANADKRNAEIAAADAEVRGNIAAGEAREQGSLVAGQQQASMAASGIDLESEFAQRLLTETKARSGLDVATIQSNSLREAWGHKVEAAGADFRRRVAKRKSVMAPSSALAGSAVTGAGYAWSESNPFA